MAHPVGQALGLVEGELHVLRRNQVDQAGRGVERRDHDGAVGSPGGARDLAGLQANQLALHGLRHGGGEGRVVGDQDGLGVGVVLGLGQQVGGDPVRVVVGAGHHHDLRRAGQGVDADHAVQPALGGGDIGVAGTHDLVHRQDRAGSMGQGGDGVGAP